MSHYRSGYVPSQLARIVIEPHAKRARPSIANRARASGSRLPWHRQRLCGRGGCR
jgi:hypothetical protein